VIGAVFERAGFDAPAPPWPRMTHAEAVGRFGSDRPDTRFGLELAELGAAVGPDGSSRSSPERSGTAGSSPGSTRARRELARSDLDVLTELAKQRRSQGTRLWAFYA